MKYLGFVGRECNPVIATGEKRKNGLLTLKMVGGGFDTFFRSHQGEFALERGRGFDFGKIPVMHTHTT